MRSFFLMDACNNLEAVCSTQDEAITEAKRLAKEYDEPIVIMQRKAVIRPDGSITYYEEGE